jgi:peptidoglycan/xylan/chitin deacetylase (PgdA/CDA1 family)
MPPKTLFRGWPFQKTKAKILAYHRISDLAESDELAVTPENFALQIEALVDSSEVVPLPSLFTTLKHSKSDRGIVAVTFDDGYLDFLTSALPVLQRYNCPATVFLATGAVGAPREFWWDEVSRIVSEGAPEALLAVVADLAHILSFDRIRASVAESPKQVNKTVVECLWSIHPPLRSEIVQAWADKAGVSLTPRESHRVMNVCEVKRVAGAESVTVGAHAVSHIPLTEIPPKEVREEVEESKRACEHWVKRPVTAFAYPFGACDWLSRDAVRKAGFDLGCAIDRGDVSLASDRLMLPRFEIRNWTKEHFTNVIGLAPDKTGGR